MRRCFLIVFLIKWWVANVFGQGVIEFETRSHDFGNLKEGTEAEKVFYFTNQGNAPIVVQEVKASCGCTTPEWTREPVLPTQKGMIKAVYHSAGRPGNFYKTITVISNATEPTLQLTIKGNVIPTNALSTIQQNVVANIPAKNNAVLEILKTEHNFGKIAKGETVIYRFPLKNTGTEDLIVAGVNAPCECVNFKMPTTTIKPNEESYIELFYQPSQTGQEPQLVEIVSSAIRQNFSKITLRAIVEETPIQGLPLKKTTKAW